MMHMNIVDGGIQLARRTIGSLSRCSARPGGIDHLRFTVSSDDEITKYLSQFHVFETG